MPDVISNKKEREKRGERRPEKRSGRGESDDEEEEEGVSGVGGAGEISASIEETNRIRAALGLKPLQVETKEDIERKKKEEEARRAEYEKKQKEEKLLETIEAMRKKRLKDAKLSGKSIAEQATEEDDDAMAWVLKTRAIEKQKAEERAKMLDELEEGITGKYGAKDLKGLKVGHTSDEFIEGETYIMTLKDQRIVDGDELNEDEDELENLNLVEKDKTEKNNELKKKKKVYDVYAEAASGESTNLLSQYDDEKPKETMIIGEEQKKESALERIKKKLAQKQESPHIEYSLDIQKQVASEYYTKEELVKFNKGSGKKKIRKKKTKESKKMSEILLEQAEDENDEKKDKGSRKYDSKVHRDNLKKEALKEEKAKAYARAIEKAEENAKVLRNEEETDEQGDVKMQDVKSDAKTDATESESKLSVIGPKIKLQKKIKAESRAWLDDDDEDKEYEEDELDQGLWKSIATATTKAFKTPVESIVEKVKSEREKPATSSSSSSGGLVFTTASEFCRTIDPTANITAQPIQHKKITRKEYEAEAAEVEMTESSDIKSEEKEEEELKSVLEEEPLAASGLAATLALLKRRGETDPLANETFSGRKTDKSGTLDRGEFGIKLEYRDPKTGRLLTQKEAFNLQSHKFHGKGPGKNKIEIRERQRAEKERTRQMGDGDTPLEMVKAMKEQQSKTKLPYVMLSGSVVRTGSLNDDFNDSINEDSIAKKGAKRARQT